MPNYRIQVLDRAIGVLDVIAEARSLLSVAEITSRLGLSKSTTHRLVMALESHGLIKRFLPEGKYGLGSRLRELGSRAADPIGLIEASRRPIADLAAATGETAHLGVLSEGEVLSIFAVEGPRTLRTPSTVGRRTPMHASSLGKSILAALPGEEADRLLRLRPLRRFTAHTVVDAARLHSELAETRRRGYAVDNEEFEEGLSCIGAVVFDSSGKPVAAASIAGPANRVRRSTALAERVRRAAREISVALGGRPDRVGRSMMQPPFNADETSKPARVRPDGVKEHETNRTQ